MISEKWISSFFTRKIIEKRKIIINLSEFSKMFQKRTKVTHLNNGFRKIGKWAF